MEVINSTRHSGLGEGAARVLTNIGVDVVSVSDSEEERDSCLVLSEKDKKNSHTIKKIRRIFNCGFEERKESGGRVDIEVMVGEDYYKKLTLR